MTRVITFIYLRTKALHGHFFLLLFSQTRKVKKNMFSQLNGRYWPCRDVIYTEDSIPVRVLEFTLPEKMVHFHFIFDKFFFFIISKWRNETQINSSVHSFLYFDSRFHLMPSINTLSCLGQ